MKLYLHFDGLAKVKNTGANVNIPYTKQTTYHTCVHEDQLHPPRGRLNLNHRMSTTMRCSLLSSLLSCLRSDNNISFFLVFRFQTL